MFRISIWGPWNFVWGAKPAKAPPVATVHLRFLAPWVTTYECGIGGKSTHGVPSWQVASIWYVLTWNRTQPTFSGSSSTHCIILPDKLKRLIDKTRMYYFENVFHLQPWASEELFPGGTLVDVSRSSKILFPGGNRVEISLLSSATKRKTFSIENVTAIYQLSKSRRDKPSCFPFHTPMSPTKLFTVKDA